MSWVKDKERLQAIARKIDPSVRLCTKDGWFWKVLGAIVHVFTFGGISYTKFLNDYATTIFCWQAYPASWSALQVLALIPHESRHTRQARWCGAMIHPLAGAPVYFLLYILMPPWIKLCFFRYWFERDADAFHWRQMLRDGYEPQAIRGRAERFGRAVANKYMAWPESWAVKGFLKKAEQVILEHGGATA